MQEIGGGYSLTLELTHLLTPSFSLYTSQLSLIPSLKSSTSSELSKPRPSVQRCKLSELKDEKLSLFLCLLVLFVISVDDDDDEVETWGVNGDDIGLSLKWSSPNISVKEWVWSVDFRGFIWFHERDSSRVDFSGKRVSKM